MTNLGDGGPPRRVPPPPDLDLSFDEISQGEQIGRGGSSVVHRIKISDHDRQELIAVKQPDSNGTIHRNTVERFTEEAKVWESLTASGGESGSDELPAKSHIVDIIDWGDTPVPWIAMEYMDGGNLRDILVDDRLPLDQALWVGYCICRAVRHAHRHGVVHHDIKPENVLFRNSTNSWKLPKVSDWGLARVMLNDGDGVEGLTPAYAAPEQFSPGNLGQPDWATDIYQIGALTYELVTGQRPFEGSTNEIVEAKLARDPAPPSEIMDVPEGVDEAILRALKREKRDRYDSIDYLRDELLALFEIHHQERESTRPDTSRGGATADEASPVAGSNVGPERVDAQEATDDSPTATGTDSQQDQKTAGLPSWNEYRRDLERRQSGFLFSTLPDGLRRLFYRDLVTEVEQAEAQRKRTQSDVESVKSRARELRTTLNDELHNVRRQGKPLPEAAVEAIGPLEDTLARIDSLRRDQVEYLRSDEQSTLASLHDELAALEAYVKAKRKLDREVAEIAAALDDTETEVDAALNVDRLLTESEERELLDKLSDASRWIRTARRELTTDPLTELDIEQFDELIEREKLLRQRVTGHNESLTQQRFNSQVDGAMSVRNRVRTELEAPRSKGESLPRPVDAFFEEIDPNLDALDTLLGSRKREFLDDDQITEVDELRDNLDADRRFVRAKARFDARIDAIRSALGELETAVEEHLNWNHFLTATERSDLEAQIDQLRDYLFELAEETRIDLLAPSDRQRFDDYVEQVQTIGRDVDRYNDRFVSQERERYTGTFDELLGDDRSLNERQELAVYRDEVHNRVIAGAGTGKTFSLACRIKYLLEKGVPPEDILALTFNRQAASEMEDRLVELFDITSVDCRTIHSFGLQILRQADPGLVIVEGESRLREVGGLIHDRRYTDSQFSNHFDRFMDRYEATKVSGDRQTRKEFYNSRRFQPGTTLGGEHIDSRFDEVREVHTAIADFLFEHGIEYRYRQYADWANNPAGDAYIPDFTLPDHDVYIEYVPSESVRRRQRAYRRKRSSSSLESIFRGSDGRLVTISGDAISPDSVTKLLRYHLDELDVEYGSAMGGQTLHDAVYEHAILERDVVELFDEFIKKARTNQVDLDARLAALDGDEDPMLFHFAHAAARLVEPYERRYREYDASDYVDMILRSTSIIRDGKADRAVNFGHVLVDEFQDLNFAQIQFVQSILSRSERVHLFAVGDDWQSIYGFKGARPDYFVDFHEYFDPALDTRLETNYRCPPAVVEAGNRLISNNEVWTEKAVSADKTAETTPRVHVVPGSDDFQYVTNAIAKIGNLVEESIDKGRAPANIMVLARNEEGSPFVRRISKHLTSNDVPVGGSDGVRVMTAHQAKGGEAGHVIVANAVRDAKDGFPSKDEDRSLTEIVELAGDSTLDEERRLFYMALTRTTDRLDIQTRASQQSPFVTEIHEHVRERHVLVDCEPDRTDITATAEDTIARETWNILQKGKLVSDDGYGLDFIVPETATDAPPLEEGERYRFEGIEIGEYNGNPQFRIDEETTVTELSAPPRAE